MTPESEARLADTAACQHAIFARPLIDELGFSKRQRARRIQEGRWVELFDGVYRFGGAPITWRGELLAACLAGAPFAAASHRSAAALRDLPGGDRTLQEILCPRWDRAQRPGLIVHESMVLTPQDVTTVDHIPVTTVERTLVDLGAVRGIETVERAVESALRRDLTSIESLEATVQRLGRRGRRGVGVLRNILAVRTVDRALTESDMEMLLLQILRKNGLPEPTVQYEIWHKGRFIARVDAAYIEWRIALEYESYEHHIGRTALVRDSARRNKIVGADWYPIAVTWEDLRSGSAQVCKQVRAIRDRSA